MSGLNSDHRPLATGNWPLIYYWLPPLFWMAVIFIFSTDLFSSRQTDSRVSWLFSFLNLALNAETIEVIHFFARKLAHLSAYGILAWLLYRALRRGRSPAWSLKIAVVAFAISGLYAIVDEVHQSFTIERTASAGDVLLDWCGSVGGLLILSARGGGILREK